MSRELQIIWQTPGTEAFASVQWDDSQPDAILIMVGASPKRYKVVTKKIWTSHLLVPWHKWRNLIAAEAQPQIRDLVKLFLKEKAYGSSN